MFFLDCTEIAGDLLSTVLTLPKDRCELPASLLEAFLGSEETPFFELSLQYGLGMGSGVLPGAVLQCVMRWGRGVGVGVLPGEEAMPGREALVLSLWQLQIEPWRPGFSASSVSGFSCFCILHIFLTFS